LNDKEAERIEGKIILNEASVALRNMKHSKSPGTDGFNAEFFEFFKFSFVFEQNRHASSWSIKLAF